MYGVLIAVPAVIWLRLPRRLIPPSDADGPEFERHLAAVRRRLRARPEMKGVALETREQLEAALASLEGQVDAVISKAAGSVFLSTAISQNGRLDTPFVLGAHTRMVWEIAHVYHQRPSLRDMARLYGNVAGTAFIAGRLEDVDLRHLVEPVVSSTLGSLVGAVPGLQAASGLLLTSVMTGSVNAFLTLRVGVIAKRSGELDFG